MYSEQVANSRGSEDPSPSAMSRPPMPEDYESGQRATASESDLTRTMK